MAEDTEDEQEQADGTADGGGRRRMLPIIVILAVLLVGGGAVGAYVAGAFDGGDNPDDVEAQADHGQSDHGGGGGHGAEEPSEAVFYDLPEMLVDLNGRGRKRSFLKIRVSLELENSADTHALDSVLPRVIDHFQVYLRELRPDDLKGSEGIYRLREELLMRVNAAARPARVRDILFKDMLIQ